MKIVADLMTLTNLILGLFATFLLINLNATRDQIVLAAKLMIAAGVLDNADGRLARFAMRKYELTFFENKDYGSFLDSLGDAISFATVPALLIINSMNTHPDENVKWFALLAGLSIIAAGVYRLIRYSVEHSTPIYFIGLPTPATATVAVGFALLPINEIIKIFGSFLVALAMVSNFKFPTFKVKLSWIDLALIVFYTGVVLTFIFAPEPWVTYMAWIMFPSILLYIFGGPIYIKYFKKING